MNAAINPGYEPSIAVRKRTELNFTPSSPIVISSSSSTASHQHQQPVGDSELSTSPAKKSSIPMPINGQIILRKDGNQATTNNQNQSLNGSSGGKMQQSQSKAEDVNGDEDPLCEDILSCISALDEVIAEFDDPVSLTSLPSPTPSPPVPAKVATLPQTAHEKTPIGVSNSHNATGSQPPHPKPAFSRLITTLSTHPQEPSVTIMQKESQTVTKIQIGSGQASGKASSTPSGTTSSSSSSYVVSSPTSAPAGAVSVVSWKNPQVIVSQNNNPVSSVSSQHYSKRQQVQPQPPPIKPQVIVQLKQSDFTPDLAPTRESTFRTFKGSPTGTLEDTRNSDEEPRALFKNSFTNYELVFPKSPTPGPRAHKTGHSAAVKRFPADIIITPQNYNKQNNNNSASEVVVGAHPSQINGSSYPKIKQRQDLKNSIVMEEQAVNIRQTSTSPATSVQFKPIPASFANNNVVIVDAKEKMLQQQDTLKEHWNFLSEENLPRSLRKTRKVILDEDEEGNVRNVETSDNANQINPCTAAVRKIDQTESTRDQDAATPVRNKKKQKLTPNSGGSESKKLRQQQQVFKKGIDQQSPHHNKNQTRNLHSDADVVKNRNMSHNNKNTYSKESGQSSRKTILTNFMFFPLTGTSSPEDQLRCEEVEAAINKINNNVQQQQGGNIKSQINSKPTKYNGPPSAAPRGPNALPANVAQLDVDDGYLSMINRHDPPIIWPETYIESETFTPEELKKLSSMKQERHPCERELKPNKLMSSLTTSEEKTDYFSDDSLENEQVDEAENLHLSYVIATQEVDRSGRRIQCNVNTTEEKPPCELNNARNMCRKSSSSSCESPITPSSPVKKPLAFFIPLADSELGKEKKEPCTKANAESPLVSATKDEKTYQVKAAKAESLVVAPVVNTILENVLRVGVQEASAINYLLSSATSDENEDTGRTPEFHQKFDLIQEPIEDMPLLDPPTLLDTDTALEHGSSNEIFETNQEFPVRTSQYEADIEDIDDEVPVREASPTKDSEKMKKKRKSKTTKNHEEWKQEMKFVEDFDQPPPFIPAPPPVKVALVPKTTEHVTEVQPRDQSEGHWNGPVKPNRNSSPLPASTAQITLTRGSMEHLCHNGVDQQGKILFTKSYHRSADPDVDYRMKMQRQASRSHENLLDIRSRQRDFLTPRRSQGQSCTLPPNTVPPVNQRRHSTFRQFLGGIFKRSKKSDASFSGDVPDSPFEDMQFSFGRKNIFQVPLPETTPNANSHDLPYNERKLSFTNSPHGSQRSTRSTPVKRGLLSRIFHRKDK